MRQLKLAIRSLALPLAVGVAVQGAAITPSSAAVYGKDLYFEQKSVNCQGNTCELKSFTRVPNNKLLVITRAACGIRLEGSQELESVVLGRIQNNQFSSPSQFLGPVSFLGQGGGTFRYQVNADAGLPMPAFTLPAVRVTAFGAVTSMSVSCSLYGRLQDD